MSAALVASDVPLLMLFEDAQKALPLPAAKYDGSASPSPSTPQYVSMSPPAALSAGVLRSLISPVATAFCAAVARARASDPALPVGRRS